jgi:hypothetical protein
MRIADMDIHVKVGFVFQSPTALWIPTALLDTCAVVEHVSLIQDLTSLFVQSVFLMMNVVGQMTDA